MLNPIPEGYKSLTAAAYGPGYTTSQGAEFASGYRIELQAPEGPEMADGTLGEVYTTGATLAAAARNLAQLLYHFAYRGGLVIADETHRTTYIVFDLSKSHDQASVKWHAIETDFGQAQGRIAAYHSNIATDTPWDPSDPPMSAARANAEARVERLKQRTRTEQEQFKDTDVSVNSFNSDPEVYTYAEFAQSQATLNLMADWLEDRDGLTTHLAASIARSLHEEMSDPGSTYSHISEVGHRPLEDIAVLKVEDYENNMDLVVEVRKLDKH